MSRHRTATAIAALLVPLVGACGGGGADEASPAESGAAGQAADLAEDTVEAETAFQGRTADEARRAGPAALTEAVIGPAYVIRNATVTVRTADVGAALQRVQAVVAAANGLVADESTTADRRGEPRRSTLTLRVPVGTFDSVIADLSRLGRLESLTRTSKDVSTQVVDVRSRITSAEASIRRIRLLLARATDLGDVIRLESELSQRQADLESLQAQRAYLADQTALSTITLTLLTPDRPAAPLEEPEEAGFLAGLATGWSALLSFLTGLSTVLGAVLPFAALALLLGLPAWLVLRRQHLRRPAQGPTG